MEKELFGIRIKWMIAKNKSSLMPYCSKQIHELKIMLTAVTLFVLGVMFLYLLGVVSAHQREFKEMRQGTQDSIRMNDTMFILKGVECR